MRHKQNNNKNTIGQSLVEIVLVIGLMSVLLPALIVGILSSREGKAQQKERLEATALLKETTEAVRSFRESGWSSFAVNGTFHPTVSGSSWILTSGPDTINNFTRAVDISNVSRNSSGTITTTGGTLDPSTKKVTITIAWNTPFPSSVQSIIYLTRTENLSYTETTESQFNAGTTSGTTVTNTNGGEVILGAGGGGNWCEPNPLYVTFDLPKNGAAHGISATEGRILAATGDNSSGVSFANVGVSNTNPPIPSLVGTFDGYKTNDIYVEGNYVYLATDTNSKEVVIVDISSLPYQEVGYFDAPGSNNGISVFVKDNIGYLVQSNVFWNFDLSSKTGSRPKLDPDGLTLGAPGAGESLFVVNNNAYIPVYGVLPDLQIVDVSNPTNLVNRMSLNVAGYGKGIALNSTGTRLYQVNSNSPNGQGGSGVFYIHSLDSSGIYSGTLSAILLNGLVEPTGITLATGNRAIIIATGGENYQVLNIANESSPVRCGGLTISSGVRGVTTMLESDGDAYAYLITGDVSSELKIIEGGPGGLYASSGTFESATFDPGYQTAFNRTFFSVIKPENTNIVFQIASTDAISSNCSGVTFNYVGPDGTNTSFFNTASPIPLDDDSIGFENPARCFRYKAYLSTADSFASPILQDITVNYSP